MYMYKLATSCSFAIDMQPTHLMHFKEYCLQVVSLIVDTPSQVFTRISELAIHTRPTDAPSSHQLSIPESIIFSSFLRYSIFRGAFSRHFMKIQLHNVSVSCMALCLCHEATNMHMLLFSTMLIIIIL